MMQLHFNFFVNFNSLIWKCRSTAFPNKSTLLKFSTYSCTMEFYTESPLTSKVVCEFWEHFSSFSPGRFCKSFQDVVLRKGHNRVSCLLDQRRNLPLQETNEKSSRCKFSYKFNFFLKSKLYRFSKLFPPDKPLRPRIHVFLCGSLEVNNTRLFSSKITNQHAERHYSYKWYLTSTSISLWHKRSEKGGNFSNLPSFVVSIISCTLPWYSRFSWSCLFSWRFLQWARLTAIIRPIALS